MFHTILVAIDRSEMSWQGFEEALALATQSGARLILLHVLSPEDEERPSMPVLFGKDFFPTGSSRSVMQIYSDLWQEYVERGMALLQSLAQNATAQGVAVTCIQADGDAGVQICEAARRLNADLVVVGRRGNNAGMRELLFGSVSNYVLHHAPCCVLIVQPVGSVPSAAPSNAAVEARLG